jgi:HPt (histidine-containing phosphotransfer) domain-containing protein
MAEEAYTVTLARDFQELIPEFIENRRRELEALRGALAARRYDQLSELGHCMRGIGTSYGFERVSILGDQIEGRAAAADLEGVAARIDEYAEYLARVRVLYE